LASISLKDSVLQCHQPLFKGYFKIRNSTMKLDCVGFKNVENFFHFITQGRLMKNIWRGTFLVLGSVLLSYCSAFILQNLNFVMIISHFLYWLLESLKPNEWLSHSNCLSLFQIQLYILALIFLLLHIFTFFKILKICRYLGVSYYDTFKYFWNKMAYQHRKLFS